MDMILGFSHEEKPKDRRFRNGVLRRMLGPEREEVTGVKI